MGRGGWAVGSEVVRDHFSSLWGFFPQAEDPGHMYTGQGPVIPTTNGGGGDVGVGSDPCLKVSTGCTE